jgi:hypothetical protein
MDHPDPSRIMLTKEKRTKKEKNCGKRFAFTHSPTTTTKTFYLFELKKLISSNYWS